MIFCDVHNTGRGSKSHFIIARDEEHAKEIAGSQMGSPKAVTILEPEYNIQELMDSGKTGILAKEILPSSFNDIMFGTHPEQPKKPWFFLKEVK